MTPDQISAALREIASLGIKVPVVPPVDASKWVLLFLRDGAEIAGTLKATSDLSCKVELLNGQQREVPKSEVAYQVTGRTYDRGPPARELRDRQGRIIAGMPVRRVQSGLHVKTGTSATRTIPGETLEPRWYYRVARYLQNARSPAEHFELGKLAWSLGLKEEANREFTECARASGPGGVDLLIVLPYLHPKTYLEWQLTRPATGREMLRVAEWAGRCLGPQAKLQAYQAAMRADPAMKEDGNWQMDLATALINAGRLVQAEKLLDEVQTRFTGPVRTKATVALQWVREQLLGDDKRRIATDVGRVMPALFQALELQAAEVVRKSPLSFPEARDAAIDLAFHQAVVQASAKKTRLAENVVVRLLSVRKNYSESYRGMMVRYGAATWLVDPPAKILEMLPKLTSLEAEQNIYWRNGPREEKVAVVMGLYAEKFLQASSSRVGCPRCAVKRMPSERRWMDCNACRGTGYHRVLQVR